MNSTEIPADHPRAESLRIREKLVEHFLDGTVVETGLIAHGRGEAFDYLLGEKTAKPALRAIEAAAAAFLDAKNPVISVNGNAAALVAEEIAKLAEATHAKIEVNLFYRSLEREIAVKKLLEMAGAHGILGVGENASARIAELNSERRRVDPRGIIAADVVMVPLEDGDRTEALVKMRKKVVAIDLNPLSRTAQKATITIVDNIVRTAPKLVEAAQKLKKKSPGVRREILRGFDNENNLVESLILIRENLSRTAERTACGASEGPVK
jgi:4-phosphopantoate--beta-alanine ligase